MSLNLYTFSGGMTDYITKHNANYSAIQSGVNTIEADVTALKAAGAPGADLDYRVIAQNLLINGAFDFWQRGISERPDAWEIEGEASPFVIARDTTIKLNTYSVKIEDLGQLTQALDSKIKDGISASTPLTISVGVWVYTSVANNARIGIYNGVTTQWSSYHAGDSTWLFLTKNQTFSSEPTSIKIVLEAAGLADVYWNAAVAIKGNPSAGPIFVVNDPALEELRVVSLYELGKTSIGGVGYVVASDRILTARIKFTVPKKSTPALVIITSDTGYDFDVSSIDRFGFDLDVVELGGASGANGFVYDGIEWSAEV